ncbi:MAG: hypothetical protein VCA36_11835 [Opitutales bacterium]
MMKSETGKRKTEKLSFAGLALMTGFVLGGCVSTGGANGSEEANATAATDPFTAESIPPEQQKWDLVYENDFSSYAVAEEPEDLFILDGVFSVREVEGNKVLALPGTPIGDFGILFGPPLKGQPAELRCRVYSTRKGRRMPAFIAGLGGLNGFRMRIDCAADRLRLIRAEEVLSEAPFAWKSGSWMRLRFRVEPLQGEGVKISGKAWDASDKEPLEWKLVHRSKVPFPGGKCVLWGIPYASSEIFFDDLKVFSLAP